MLRNFTIIALVGLLAACSAQGGGDTTDPSNEATASAAASATASASGDPATGPAGDVSPACGDAFGALAGQDVSSLSDLADLKGVEATIEQCESVADWMAGAGETIGDEVNPSTAQLLLEIRCELPALAGTAVCEEVAAS